MVVHLSEEQRAKLVIGYQYDPNDTLRNLLRWKGTIFAFVVQKGQVWCLITFHAVLWAMYHYHTCLDEEGDPLSDCTPTKEWLDRHLYPPSLRDLAPLIGAFMFCIIFYLQSAYAVYREFYFNGISIAGAVKNAAFIVRASLQNKDARWDVVRHLVCSQRVLYWEVARRSWQWRNLPDSDPSNPGTIVEMAERELVPKGLIRREEIPVLDNWRGSLHQLFYSWAIQVFRRELLLSRNQVEEVDPLHTTDSSVMSDVDAALTLQQFSNLCCNLRDAGSKLHAMLLIPVPFPYYHLVEAMSFSVQLVMAYAFININGNLRTQPPLDGEVEEIRTSHLAILIFPLTVFVCTGITEMANKMQDPFGDDEVDFNMQALKNDLYLAAEAQCHQEYDAIPIPEEAMHAVDATLHSINGGAPMGNGNHSMGNGTPMSILPNVSRHNSLRSTATGRTHSTDRSIQKRATMSLPMVRGGLEGIIGLYDPSAALTRVGSDETTLQRLGSDDTYQGSFKQEPQSPRAVLRELSNTAGSSPARSVSKNGYLREPPTPGDNPPMTQNNQVVPFP
mmetsp:Transcript_7576/g.18940  ORF Transcript_7576/g.18940 Transcript_7576/m.18940 type:complete len:560 (-) Transcript_7576:109-1788(-)